LHCTSSEMKRWTSKRFPFSSGHSVGAVLIMGSERAERAAKVKTNKHIDNRAIFSLKWKKNDYSLIIPTIYYFQYVQHVPESFFVSFFKNGCALGCVMNSQLTAVKVFQFRPFSLNQITNRTTKLYT
jgi:hypothetical protein